jgi:hypothetical protein
MAVEPTTRESSFDVSELFFSTTDRKGVIRAGNDVFVRVSKHAEDALIGSPHNIIRHPDMPRAAFRLLWDHLLRGLPIAAYVKNLAADGSFYWVMACVMPSADGYLSVRLKPTAGILEAAVIPIYTRVREFERELEASGTPRRELAERSAGLLLEAIAEAGFADYAAFIRMALPREIRARQAALASDTGAVGAGGVAADLCVAGRHLDGLFAGLEGYAAANEALGDSTRFIHHLAGEVRMNATNGMIAASKLTEGAATLSAVADQMSRCATGIAAAVEAFSDVVAPAMDLLHDLEFRISLAKAQVDMATYFAIELERGDHPPDVLARRHDSLDELLASLRRDVNGLVTALRVLDQRFLELSERTDPIEMTLRSLGALHIAGRVEVAGVGGAAGFAVLFDEVQRQVEAAEGHVQSLRGATRHSGESRRAESALRASIAHAARGVSVAA